MQHLKKSYFLSRITALLILTLLFVSCTNKTKENSESVATATTPKKITVTQMKGNIYTTAHKTDLKLSKTGALAFSELKQPLETDIDVLVDPNKQFQTLMGIGAALTDAAAETFYKLSAENQDKFLEAYYDKEKQAAGEIVKPLIGLPRLVPFEKLKR